MTIEQMHDMIKFLKSQGQNGFHSPEQIDSALNLGSFDKFNEEKRLFESTQYISDNLRNFKTSADITCTAGSGPLPANYDYATNAVLPSSGVKVDIVPESEWPDRRTDPIDIPSTTKPIITIRSQLEVYPSSVVTIGLYYLKRPATMVFGYTDDDGDYVYDSGTSTQCDWPATCHGDLILRALVYLGTPLSDDLMIRLKDYKRKTEGV
jgi:hypothetical protein